MARSQMAIGFWFVIASAILIPIHFLVGDLSFAHVVLQLIAALVFLVTVSMGLLAFCEDRGSDERRSKVLEPALAALAIAIIHGLCSP